ncbi:unnamed protein product (macronuclear) [Paramecium tetraurelia]|uniref:B box-type domain-containing protein n=1 Tax=Paramecium tetraurelia TaxID=5888 RepID=A0CN38_PARTE|nr:uncharacterized protein GSPATT00008646001 [Paramecium tetraurelia]CAK72205.1 unnamed protein product [Paramecium tetraurelia]|eukprot:XP_001439602.1 hypothetical protein (macronuclear) [Paramecium tetraurelia strain d4-2]
MFQQSEATLGYNRNQTENQPDSQRDSSVQQNPLQQVLTDEQKSIGILNPYVFTSYNMPKINCYNHFGQTITNFCKTQECRLPLCPECVKEHVNEHSEFKTYPKLECLENILTQVHSDICQQANQITHAQYGIEKSVAQAYAQTTFTVEKLKEAKKRILNVIEQYFDTLENELENKQKKNYENFKRDADALLKALKARNGAYLNFLDKLQQPECMYSLLPYLASPSQEDNQQYLQIANKFTSRFKEVQSEITFDSFKSAQLSSRLSEIVGVIHQDLTEYLDIHKLAPPEIVKSKALTLKSQNNQIQKKASSPQQRQRNLSKTYQLQENKDKEIIKVNPNQNQIEQTVRYQQINPQSIQIQQYQSPSNFNSLNQNYPQQFTQQQPQYYSNQPQYSAQLPYNQQRYQQQVPYQQYLQYDQNAQYQNTINPIQKYY